MAFTLLSAFLPSAVNALTFRGSLGVRALHRVPLAPPEKTREVPGPEGLDQRGLAHRGVAEDLELDLGQRQRGRDQLLDVVVAAGLLKRGPRPFSRFAGEIILNLPTRR